MMSGAEFSLYTVSYNYAGKCKEAILRRIPTRAREQSFMEAM